MASKKPYKVNPSKIECYSITHPDKNKIHTSMYVFISGVGNCQVGTISNISGVMSFARMGKLQGVIDLFSGIADISMKQLFICNDREDNYKRYKELIAPAVVSEGPSFISTNKSEIRNFTINYKKLIECLQAKLEENDKKQDLKEKVTTKDS